MRKDSLFIAAALLLISAAIVVGAYYHFAQQPLQAASQTAAVDSPAVGDYTPTYETTPSRTDTPIRCTNSEIGEFYTNAVTCDQADLHNRLSIAESRTPIPSSRPYSGQGYQRPEQQAKQTRQPKSPCEKLNLRLAGKSPPSGLGAGCKFAVGRALEIERDLSAADDPTESVWQENYCRWRCEAEQNNCGVPDEYYCYSFSKVCQQHEWNLCWLEAHNGRRGQG